MNKAPAIPIEEEGFPTPFFGTIPMRALAQLQCHPILTVSGKGLDATFTKKGNPFIRGLVSRVDRHGPFNLDL